MPSKSRIEGSKRESMTWREISADPYTEDEDELVSVFCLCWAVQVETSFTRVERSWFR